MSKTSLGRLVQRTRQSRGLSQYALSKAAGIPMPYVQRLENGEYDTFPSQYLENLSQVLDVSMDTLSAELEKPDRPAPAGGVSIQVTGKPDDVDADAEATDIEPAGPETALASEGPGPVDITGSGQPLLSLVPPVDPERLMADISMLSDDDQKRVAAYVQDLLHGSEQES